MGEPSSQIMLDLDQGTEWRFELEADENIAVRVHSSDPLYINSEELPPTTWYPVHRHTKGAIYSPTTKAKLEVSSLPASQYMSTSTTQPQLTTLHLALERQRILAKRHLLPSSSGNASSSNEGVERGPRVMIIGPPSSGKTTIVKNLVNMALGSGMGWEIGVVGLDPGGSANLVPGSLTLSTPRHPLPTHHIAQPLGSPPTSIPSSTLSADVPTLGWWYGALEPSTKGSAVWSKLVSNIGDRWRERCAKDAMAMASGLFVDTSSAFATATLGTKKADPKARYTLVQQAVEAFEIDTILVIGHEKLTLELDRLFAPLRIRTIRFPKSGGVVDLDETSQQTIQAFQVRTYFYGPPTLPKEITGLSGRMVAAAGEMGLSPYSFQIGWETLHVLRVGEENAAPSSALPLGSARILSPTRLTKVDPGGPAHVVRLLNTVLALVSINPEDRIPKIKPVDEGVVVKPEPAVLAIKDVKTEPKAEESGVAGDGGEGSVKPEASNEEAEVEGQVKTELETGDEAHDIGEDTVAEVEVDEDEDEVPFLEEIGTREVLGFIVITGIDPVRRKYTILSPSPGKLPSTVAIAGSIEWVDSE